MNALVRKSTIAVVGMGCRFPQASSIDQYWRNLAGNVDSITPVPRDRFDVDACYSSVPRTPGHTVSRFGGFLDDPFTFDPTFFGIAPSEAAVLDPQHRLLLAVAWEALEDAGIVPSSLAGSRTGVFVGQATAEYSRRDTPETYTLRDVAGSHLRSMATGRISYALDLRGPNLVVDTACSSSLVAVHAACQSLRAGESDLAFAGGANVILSPMDAIAYSQAAMLSPDGRCKFGADDADGFVRSEGVGVVLLKRLVDAERDGDRILGVLLGSSVVNDGRGSGLLFKPAVSGQVDMLRTACREAGIEPADLDYVEAHGTGTTAGDSVELTALAEAVRERRTAGRPLRTGSVKSNIGHTEAAAGLAGLIKAVLVVRHGLIPASLHANPAHPLLSREDVPVEVVTANAPLEPAGDRALVGVSSFGLSGTNAHVVVAAHTPADTTLPTRTPTADSRTGPTAERTAPFAGNGVHLLVLSARSRHSLTELALSYADFLAPDGAGRAHSPADVCAAAALRRESHPYRLWVTGHDHDELAAGLRALADGRETEGAGTGEAGFGSTPRTVFVFPGQGSQWAGMGRTLLDSSPAFRRTLQECDAAVREETGWSVIDVLAATDGEFPTDVATVQPVLWAVQTALSAHWQAMGVRPDVCVGHSMGEVAAACASGALSLPDAAAVICRRSRLMSDLADRGGMLVTELAQDEAAGVIRAEGRRVCVAAENAPDSTVLAGDRAALRRIADALEERGVFHRAVPVNVASHSPAMDALRTPLLEALAGLRPGDSLVPMHSSVFCSTVDGPRLDATYWMENLRRPVRFRESIQHLAKEADSVFLEVSPHPVLTAAMRTTLDHAGATAGVTDSTRRQQDERTALTRALGHHFAHGGAVDWEGWFGGKAPHVPLPSYQWHALHLRRDPAGPTTKPPAGRTRDFSFDDRATGVSSRGFAPVPPVVHLSVLHEVARSAHGDTEVVVTDALIGDSWPEIPDGGTLTLRAEVTATPAEGGVATVSALRGDPPAPSGTPCLTASVRPAVEPPAGVDLDGALTRCRSYWSGAEFLRRIAERGYEVAPAFRTVQGLWRRDGEAVALLHRPATPRHTEWEACLLPLLAALPDGSGAHVTYRPQEFGYTRLLSDLPETFWVHVSSSETPKSATATADVVVAAPDSRPLAEFRRITLRRGAEPVNASPLPPSPTTVLLSDTTALLTRTVNSGRRTLATWLSGLLTPDDKVTTSPIEPPRAASAVPTPRPEPTVLNVPGPPRPSVPEPGDEAGSTASRTLVRSAARLLGMAPELIDEHRPLREYGLDSLMALQLRRELKEHGIEITPNRLVGVESPVQ
ncbi:type I polyketide synthase, partial [Streptomyces sp. NPDC058877]|uniref:type I polyketide synthase n=1 Tax=Streptomyces sp. NPDC058877 TaxID=3346665 RepID=UPI00369196F1